MKLIFRRTESGMRLRPPRRYPFRQGAERKGPRFRRPPKENDCPFSVPDDLDFLMPGQLPVNGFDEGGEKALLVAILQGAMHDAQLGKLPRVQDVYDWIHDGPECQVRMHFDILCQYLELEPAWLRRKFEAAIAQRKFKNTRLQERGCARM